MKKYLLLSIIVLAAILRLTFLDQFPSGLNSDEAALGYNAYSLVLTGKDEHGHLLPVNLESFGDFKPALYSYLLVPFVKFFGLTEFVVRLPSAIFGILAVFLIYVLCQMLNAKWQMGVISSLLLAISPWHLHFSRGAWEVNVATTLILLGVILFLKWVRTHNSTFYILSSLVFVLSLYTYQSARIIAPLLVLSLVIQNRQLFFLKFRKVLKNSLIAILLIIPLLASLLFTDAGSRLGGVGLTADIGPLNFVKELRGQHQNSSSLLSKLTHNRPVIYSIQFVKNYLSHFDGDFLFISGDVIERNRVPETGLLYLTDILLLVLGVVYLLKIKKNKLKIIILWLFIAPIASAMTFQVPHALRAQNMIIPLTIICAAGTVQFFDWVKLLNFKYLKFICYLLFVICYFYQFPRYLHQYYVHYPKTYPTAWQYGFKQIAQYVSSHQNRFDKVLITNAYDQPYALMLFYLKYDPRTFQSNHELTVRDRYNFSTVERFDKYQFLDTAWEKVRDVHGSLIIAKSDDIPLAGVNVVDTIKFPDGRVGYKIISN